MSGWGWTCRCTMLALCDTGMLVVLAASGDIKRCCEPELLVGPHWPLPGGRNMAAAAAVPPCGGAPTIIRTGC